MDTISSSLKTKISKILFSKESFIIAKTSCKQTVCGNVFEEPEKLVNIEVEFVGEYKEHSKFGTQFEFKTYQIKQDYNLFFLTNMVKGLTQQAAFEIVQKCGDNFETILLTDPKILLSIKGIGEKKLVTIVKSFKENRHLKHLAEFLLPYGITNNAISKIYEFYKENAVIKIQENPYLLTKIRGMSFIKADEIALKIGLRPDSNFRYNAGITFSIENYFNENGHTVIGKEVLFTLSCENLDNNDFVLTYDIFNETIINLLELKYIVYVDKLNNLVTLKYLYDMELYIKNIFNELKKEKRENLTEDINKYISNKEQENNFQYGEKQKIAITLANMAYYISYLGGLAGSGKTTVVSTVLDLYANKYGEDSIVCCALSGVAANRAKTVTGYKGVTIHTLLGFKGTNDYTFNKENKLDYSIVMLDESSMVDLSLFYNLLLAIDFSKTCLLCVGDPGQLQSVGLGEIFKSIISQKLAYGVLLDKVFRQSEEQVINIFATQYIREGKVPANYNKPYDDFTFIKQDIENYWQLKKTLKEADLVKKREKNKTKITHEIIHICRKHYSFLNKWKENIWEYITDFQVITPMKSGLLGTEHLNGVLQSIFNGEVIGEQLTINDKNFRFRDKIVHLQNLNMKTVRYEHFKKHFKEIPALINDENLVTEKRVFNGQLGVIININLEENITSVYYPNEGYVAFYKESDFKQKKIDLSYCLTIHKTQGMEYANVVVPMTMSHFKMLNNQLMYTGVTRAKNHLYIVGEQYAWERACKNKLSAKRDTVLECLN